MIKAFSIAALVVGLAAPSFAGSLSDAVVEDDPDDVFVAPSSAGLGVPLAVGAGLVGLALLANNDDDAAATTTTGN